MSHQEKKPMKHQKKDKQREKFSPTLEDVYILVKALSLETPP